MYTGPYTYVGADNGFIRYIEKAINGEYSAIRCYAQLAKAAPNEEEKKQILEIRQDEKKHYRIFAHIYTQLTGKQPTPRISEPCPEVYCQGLDFAIKDEQETVDFYLDIADKAMDSFVKDAFRRAAWDEQNHAVWFLYYWTRNGCQAMRN